MNLLEPDGEALRRPSSSEPRDHSGKRRGDTAVTSEVKTTEREVQIPAGKVAVEGSLSVPEGSAGVVVFAHGTGSGRHSPRNRLVAGVLRNARFATLLMDLLTPEEEAVDLQTAGLRFDVALLAERLLAATRWLRDYSPEGGELALGYFGASTGAAAAIVAATKAGDEVKAIVSRGGRPDLAGDALSSLGSPTLLLVGSNDLPVLEMNRDALKRLQCDKRLEVVEGASHLFEEPGTLEQVARLARDWFGRHLTSRPA
jgi:putative phosphoribosyl transferase